MDNFDDIRAILQQPELWLQANSIHGSCLVSEHRLRELIAALDETREEVDELDRRLRYWTSAWSE